jgi:hypothetical protein
MGCFGSCGRSDSYGVTTEHRAEWKMFNEKHGLSGRSDYQNDHTKGLYSKPVTHIRLSDGFESLFHVRNKEIMQYLIEESPYRVCFDEPYSKVYSQNMVNVIAHGIPSEITMACLFFLRSIAHSDDLNTSFCALVPFAKSKWMALITAKMFPAIGRGDVSVTYCEGGDSVFFTSNIRKSLIHSEDPFSEMVLLHRSVRDLQGYCMNIRAMWVTGPEEPYLTRKYVQKICKEHTKPRVINGLFGKYTLVGCVDLKAFMKSLWSM